MFGIEASAWGGGVARRDRSDRPKATRSRRRQRTLVVGVDRHGEAHEGFGDAEEAKGHRLTAGACLLPTRSDLLFLR